MGRADKGISFITFAVQAPFKAKNLRLSVSGEYTTFAIRPLMFCQAESGGTALPLGKWNIAASRLAASFTIALMCKEVIMSLFSGSTPDEIKEIIKDCQDSIKRYQKFKKNSAAGFDHYIASARYNIEHLDDAASIKSNRRRVK